MACVYDSTIYPDNYDWVPAGFLENMREQLNKLDNDKMNMFELYQEGKETNREPDFFYKMYRQRADRLNGVIDFLEGMGIYPVYIINKGYVFMTYDLAEEFNDYYTDLEQDGWED